MVMCSDLGIIAQLPTSPPDLDLPLPSKVKYKTPTSTKTGHDG